MTDTTTAPTPLPRIDRFERYAFGLFMHWGLYSLVGRGEWYRHHHNVDGNVYGELMSRFTAENWNPTAIVNWAKSVGIRYVVLTTRHHDGFSLYDTRGLNAFDAPHAAAGRDLIAEYAEACHAADMPMFFYHTTLDWWHSDFDDNVDAYLQYLRDSVEILCTHYGRVGGLWFDGNWARRDRDWQEDKLYGLIREKQPEAIIVNNSSLQQRGAVGHPELDVLTFEQGRVRRGKQAGGKHLAAEMCETMNRHWGIGSTDFDFKSPPELIESLAACRKYRANFLLNIGPHADGSLPAYETAAITKVGEWIAATLGEVLYEGKPVDVTCKGSDYVIEHDGAFYYVCHGLAIDKQGHFNELFVGGGGLTIRGELPTIGEVRWTDAFAEGPLPMTQSGGLLAFDAGKQPYGSQFVCRVAKLTPA